MTGRALRCLLLLGLMLTGMAGPGRALPAGFSDTLVTSFGTAFPDGPTALAFTPDGRMLITVKGGTLRVWTGSLLPTPALTIPASSICINSIERGLLGVAVDPNFGTNRRIYLFYTANSGGTCVNRVSRFTFFSAPGQENQVDPASELILLDHMYSQAGNHNAGDVQIGKDGFLYVSIGDSGCDYAGDSGCQGANDAARDQHTLVGKILRITLDGNIPATNPFQGAGTARCNMTGGTTAGNKCQETFAWGFRNPFRFAMDPNAAGTRFFINDVGDGAREEIDEAQAGADYGWNCLEGTRTNNSSGPCSPTPTGMVPPIFEYPHFTTVPGTSVSNCSSITGGAFVPNGLWPGFDGSYLFSDFVCGAIFKLTQSGGVWSATDFATGLGGSSAVHLRFGPWGSTQALYYTTYANGGQVRRIGSEPPVPSIQNPGAAETFAVGETITLQGSATDPEDGMLPASALSWTVILHHDAHTHPFLGPVTGNNIPFTAPAPEDLAAAETSYLEVRLTATDSTGTSSTVSQNFQPHEVALTLDTDPPGLDLAVNGAPVTAPFSFTSWEGWVLNVLAPSQNGGGGELYVFAGWEDSSTAASPRQLHTPAAPATYTAVFQLSETGAQAEYFTLDLCRIVDTRGPAGLVGGPALAAGQTRTFPITGNCGVPSTARAVAVNVTVIAPSSAGHFRIWPADDFGTGVSALNFAAGGTRANHLVLPLGTAGDLDVLCAIPSGTAHLVIDVLGYFE